MASINKNQKGSTDSHKRIENGKSVSKSETKVEKSCSQFVYSQRIPNQLHASIYLSK
jgi:hypothetical protein